MSAKPLAKPIDSGWWAALTDDDKIALLQAFKFRTGVDLTNVDPPLAGRSSPALIWSGYIARQHDFRGRGPTMGARR
jgi:hypothetical protein